MDVFQPSVLYNDQTHVKPIPPSKLGLQVAGLHDYVTSSSPVGGRGGGGKRVGR